MSGLEPLLPLIYHEKQQSGSQLCAQHALNVILQGDYFSAPDLAQFAQRLDTLEGSFNNDAGTVSNNMDDTGFFSVQVLEGALRIWGFTLVRWRSQDLRDQQATPHSQMAFLLNHEEHWFSLRRFGMLGNPENGHWFNLNSFLEEPEWVGKLYLGMVLSQAEDEGYSVFAVLPTRDTPDGPVILPRTEADEVASTLPQPTSSRMGARLSTSRVVAAPSSNNNVHASGFEDEDLELQAALQASLMGGDSEIEYAASATFRAQPSSAPPTLSGTGPLTPPTNPTEFADEMQSSEAVDPVAASMARNKAIMQRMLREQEIALREGYDDFVGFGNPSGANAVSGRSGDSSRIRQASDRETAGEVEEAEAIRKAIEESQSFDNHETQELSQRDHLNTDDDVPRIQPPRPAFATIGDRVYDDEDSELQAALKASLEGIAEGFYSPPAPPRPAHVEPASRSVALPDTTVPMNEDRELEEEELKPAEVIDAEEMRRRRLARFGGQT